MTPHAQESAPLHSNRRGLLGQRGAPGRAALAEQSSAVRVQRCGLLRMGRHAVAAPCGSNEKVWPPCSFSNKEPSKTTVWLA